MKFHLAGECVKDGDRFSIRNVLLLFGEIHGEVIRRIT